MVILTVSTIKDSVSNVERFVQRNVAGGVDHLIVFLDSEQPGVADFLDTQPTVTPVRTHRGWWRGDRPRLLNDRQSINSALTARLLAWFDCVDWVFHVDGDEVVQLDRGRLAQIDPEWRVVGLAPLEVVSQHHQDGEPIWFKAPLDRDQLVLLKTLGVIGKPSNRAYFRSHIRGKVGVRPAADVQLSIHAALDGAGEVLPAYLDPSLRVLHYESPSGEEFVRKWEALLASGTGVRQRPQRASIGRALAALQTLSLSPEEARPFLMSLYERTTADDVETLRRLKLLEHVDPDAVTREPEQFPKGDLDRLRDAFHRVRQLPKRQFSPDRNGRDLTKLMTRTLRGI